jgi:hypothetical protein
VGAQPDGGGQPVGAGHHVFHHFLFLVPDIEKRPGGDGEQQHDAHRRISLEARLLRRFSDGS